LIEAKFNEIIMTQEIEILLKKELFSKTFKNILPVRVWSSKEDVKK